MPILGIMASQISGHLFTPGNSYESIATVTLTSSQSTVSFTSIPSTYKHLQMRCFFQTGSQNWIQFNYNGDTSANYSMHELRGNGSSAAAYAVATTSAPFTCLSEMTPASNCFAVGIVDIFDYSNSNKVKTIRSLSGSNSNGSGNVGLVSNRWSGTATISSIDITVNGGGTVGQYSSFALYGIRG